MVEEYPGGYADYLRQRKRKAAPNKQAKARSARKADKPRTTDTVPKRLTFKEQYEFDTLPDRITALETAKSELEKVLGDPNMFARDRAGYENAAKKLVEVEQAIAGAEDRWLELDARQEALSAKAAS